VSDFKAEMHQICFPLGSVLDLAGGAYNALPDCLYLRGLLLRAGRETIGKGEGKSEEVEIGIWPTHKFCRGASYGLLNVYCLQFGGSVVLFLTQLW